jgi:hypothetical protein
LLSYFGISIVSLLIVLFFQKLITYFLRKYEAKYLIFYFIATFSINFILYNLLIYLSSVIFLFEFNLGPNLIIGIVYNLIFACIGFYVYKILVRQSDLENQLKLL